MNSIYYDAKTSIEEKKYRLKYLYLINVDNVLSTINESSEYKNYDPTKNIDLFHRIFDVIFSASSMYNKFLDDQNPYSNNFLGIPRHDDILYRKRLTLLKLCLRNHCILYGFLSSLYKEHSCSDYSYLTAPYDNWNETGYYESRDKTFKDFQIDSTSSIYQNYNTTYLKRFNESKATNMYSAHIIRNCETLDKNGNPAIPSCLRNPLSFLYKDSKVATIDRVLLNTSPNCRLLNHYTELFSLCTKYEKSYQNINDRYLIHYFFENTYCFQALNHISQILAEINSSESSNTEILHPKDLEGSALNDILVSIMCCPLTYSRSFLLNHTYKTILDSDLSKAYLRHDANVRISYDNMDSISDNKIKKILQALSLMDDFIKTVNNYTIPILEDLWDVIFSELTDISGKSIINLNDYEQYLEDYRNILTLDYSCLSDDDINECIYRDIKERTFDDLQDETFNIGFHKMLFFAKLNKKLDSYSRKMLELKIVDSPDDLYMKKKSKYVKESLETIIKNSLTPARFDKDINNSLFPKSDDSNIHKSEQFKLNHVKELYNMYL